MIEQQGGKLTDAGLHAAALLDNQLNSGVLQLAEASTALEARVRRSVLICACIALQAGFIGAAMVFVMVGACSRSWRS